jgi:membrane protein DedA with SNARE-associated domain
LPRLAPSRLRAAVLALLAVLTVASLLGTALSPYLLVKSPLLLVLLSPAPHHVALAAASVAPAPLIMLATLRRVVFGICMYGLGLSYGRAAFEWLAQRHALLGGWIALVERLFARGGVLLLVIAPIQTLAALAGAAQSRFLPFLAALTLGHALWNGVTYYVGDVFSHWTDRIIAFLGAHLVASTLACFLAVALQQGVVYLLRQKRQRDNPSG